MIKANDVYEVFAAIVPLYIALILAYASVRWWKIFSPEQCSGINTFVSTFAIPFLSFHYIASNNPYAMNFRFLWADTLQKIIILVGLFLLSIVTKWGSVDWTITIFSLATLPNTLIMGVPLLKAMYGDFTTSLMVQILVFQTVIWLPLVLFMYEYRRAKQLISEQFSETRGDIPSQSVGSNVEIGENDRSDGASPNSEAIVVLHETTTSEGSREGRLEIGEGIQMEANNEEGNANKEQQMPNVRVMTKLILIMVWRNLIRNPNTYASVLGVAWSLIAYRWNIKMPYIIKDSISILSNTGLGVSMFSLGLFTALQPKIITCGKTWTAISMAIRFLVGPAVIAATSKAMAIRGVLLRVAVVQATLPQAIVCFVFAKEYNLHTDILSTAVIFGMVVAVPVTILYYVLLGL